MADHLMKRDGRFVYRRRYPVEVAAIVGRREFRQALDTADRRTALEKARVVSVEFDRICREALAQTARQALGMAPGVEVGQPPRVTAEAILERLRAVVDGATRSAIEALVPSQRHAPTWTAELEWRKAAMLAIAEGKHPGAADYNPAEAMAAHAALEALERGELPTLVQAAPTSAVPPEPVPEPTDSTVPARPGQTTAAEFNKVLGLYVEHASRRRGQQVRTLCKDALRWPATPAEQVQNILAYGKRKLAAGGKASSLSTSTGALLAVLRCMPGWEGIKLPRLDATAKTIRSGAGARKGDRQPIPLAVLRACIKDMQETAPAVDAAALVLLARYGMRPSELLREGPDALVERSDIMGNKSLVFQAGLTDRKTKASRRDLPVCADDAELFRLVLGERGEPTDLVRRTEQRVRRLHDLLGRRLPAGLTLYSVRHTAADLMREAKATDQEIGVILGHTSTQSMTSIYGGLAPLTAQRELLDKVRDLLEKPPA
ncbi:hypothetical protein FAS41_27840 [Pseudomonas nicosulfuronedens]|uniref:Tyr recombinase domain-containing protein n=1 Tax=Pseudomonas nicosulfuronedens TaxID=2571105 RepID=A0A5R9R9B7_9PSED|nr:DUF6538 domain-containing protein [Pseudomonas nicosulfuronedens]TLX70480.1 hypothetical protein FAS41_27840 [Pseudomonas nicosulfuronedens]